ncbi:hypothetical protein GCM10009872_41010 [Actinopolymorpha rutila]
MVFVATAVPFSEFRGLVTTIEPSDLPGQTWNKRQLRKSQLLTPRHAAIAAGTANEDLANTGAET